MKQIIQDLKKGDTILEISEIKSEYFDPNLVERTGQQLKAKSSSLVSPAFSFILFAKILAQVVFPTPRGPVNKSACAKWLFFIAFSSVFVIAFCPTTSSNV